ncbi:MAG: bifunctional homocysteine S-methyltransferase/methylenetetrahydrofolate reductase, partial [Chloroflexi bacterium]|nr:bifunctional homocysteine S-methyltransferase/methylenetetrahydrofolate reductase [Chloroflexota bacterium]
MNRHEFRARLQERPFLFDGAMGTLLHGRGIASDQCFDAINLLHPAIVADIHRAYIEAGSDIIETNSFGANRYKLAEYGGKYDVTEVNRAAVNVARRAIESSFKDVLLAGAIGPLGVRLAPLGRVSLAEAKEAFAEQIDALVNAEPRGVDILVFETLSDPKEMETAVAAAREIAPDIPIITAMTFSRDDRTLLGHTPDKIATKLAKLDVDVIGINCSGGPAQVLRLLMIMRQIAPDKLLAANPNAGWPEHIEGGRVMYPATPEYFGRYATALTEAGASIVGGCCGTTEAHIVAMRASLDNPQPLQITFPRVKVVTREEKQTAVVDPPTQLAQNLESGVFVVTVEMSPPKGIAAQRMLAGAQMLKEAGANLLNIADSPLA